MMALIFMTLFISTIAASFAYRRTALTLFAISLFLGIVVMHGITTDAPLQF